MAVWSIIKKSELEGAKRIDSEYYRRDFIEAENILKKINLIKLNQKNAFITDGQHGYFKLDPKSEIRQITAQHIKDGFIHKESADRLSSDTHKKNLRASLQFEDVVLSTVGSVGNAGIVTKDIPPANLDQNVARIHLKIKNLDPYFLTVFFLSKYGKSQIQRNITGQVQQRLSLGAVRELDVPLLKDQKTISHLLKQCHYMFMLSKKFYSKAEQILLEELRLKDLDLKDDLFYTTTLKEVKDNNRMDTEYYMPKYDCIFKAIEKEGYNRLDSISKFSKILLKKKSEIFYKYIEIGGIDVSTGDVSCKEMQGCDLPTNAKLKISGGELIISKVRPTRGAIAIVPDYLTNNCLCSGAFSVFTIKSPKREYIQVFLRSKIGKVLLGHDSTGTQYPTITDEDVKAIPIPDLSKNIMENISNKVCNAHMKRESAKALLEQAKHKVEEMIEKEAGVK